MRSRLHPLRRLGAILLGVLVMHTTWVASVSACEMNVVAADAPTAAPLSTHEHGAATANPHSHHQSDTPAAPTSHHESASVICPMAMACAQSAMTSAMPTVTTKTVAIATTLPTHVARTPRTSRVAPETPPPRG